MTFPCPRESVAVEQFCIPTCSRWTQINRGQPVNIWIDQSNYDPTCYPQVEAAGDQAFHLQQAINYWEAAYPCGQLFNIVDTAAEADVRMSYFQGTVEDGLPAGSASCLCEPEDTNSDQCSVNADHTVTFSTLLASLNIYCLTFGGNPNSDWSPSYYQFIVAHELGHLLGLGHQYNQPYPSIMGNPTILSGSNAFSFVIDLDINNYPEDKAQLEARYPCGCTLTNELTSERTDLVLRQTDEICPVCNPNLEVII